MQSSAINFEKSIRPVRYFSENETARRQRRAEEKARGRKESKTRRKEVQTWDLWTSSET